MPFDKWAILDSANAIFNTICFGLFTILTPKDLLNPATKDIFNVIQVMAVCVSWGRFLSFFLVIESISKLILTLLKMIVEAMAFIAMLICYIFLMIPIFQIMFQEDTIIYHDGIATARSLFDTMLGNYGYAVTNEDEYLHVGVLIIHIFISNIFLLNYLIAILSTVYEKAEELGNFAYQSNKYQYIERYQIAMQDEWGYEELVVHPPPINYLTGLLYLSVFKDNMMLRSSKSFSKVIFWLENLCFYIVWMLVYEALLIPLIYIKLVYSIMRVESNKLNAFFLVFVWLIIGPVYLVLGLIKDMYYYFKVLYDYHEHDGEDVVQVREDELQDKIVIYNEVVDTMRAIMNIFKYKSQKKGIGKQKKGKGQQQKKTNVFDEFKIRNEVKRTSSEKNPLKRVSEKFDLLEELQR